LTYTFSAGRVTNVKQMKTLEISRMKPVFVSIVHIEAGPGYDVKTSYDFINVSKPLVQKSYEIRNV